MKSVAALWQMQPVQTGAKALGAGLVACGAMWAYRKAASSIGGPSDTNYKILLETLPKYEKDITALWNYDKDWVDLLGRLETFRKFAPAEFDDVILAVCKACEERKRRYAKARMFATDSFAIRAEFQKIIEYIRILRSIIEYSISTAIEDFDEIASDLNSKIEQVALDAIQDTA